MKLTMKRRSSIAGYIFIAPFIIGFLLFFAYAMVMAVVYSFYDIHIVPNGYTLEAVGWKYYVDALTKHTWYPRALTQSLIDMAYQTPLIILFSFFAACLLNQKFHGRALTRLIFFLPVILASGVIVKIDNIDLINSAVLHSDVQSGSVSGQMAEAFDISSTMLAMGLPDEIVATLSSIINQLYTIITNSGVQILVFLSAMQSISPSLYEASSMEGATGWENFWKITFPMLSPFILTNVVYTVVDFFSSYNNSVMDVVMSTAQSGNRNLSYSMAMAMIYFIIAGAIIGLVIAALSRLVYYEDRR